MGGVQSYKESRITEAEEYVCGKKELYKLNKELYERRKAKWDSTQKKIEDLNDMYATQAQYDAADKSRYDALGSLRVATQSKLIAFAEYMRMVGQAEVMFNVKYGELKDGGFGFMKIDG